MVTMSDQDANKGWVKEGISESLPIDRRLQRQVLKHVNVHEPGCFHHLQEKSTFVFTPLFLLVWIGILNSMGAHYGSNKPPARDFW